MFVFDPDSLKFIEISPSVKRLLKNLNASGKSNMRLPTLYI